MEFIQKIGRYSGAIQAAILALCFAPSCRAANADFDSVLDDAKLYVTAPLRWDQRDWLYAGGSVLAIAASHHYDDRVYRHFAVGPRDSEDKYSTKDALPTVAMVAGTWALAWAMDDADGYQEGRDLLEAGVFSAVTASVLKLAVHRERPGATADSSVWFKSGDSFPSRHVSVAVAVGAVFAESGGDEYRWIRRGLGYGLGAATAYKRLKHQQHWLSDTVGGAAVGMATARFVLNRHSPDAALSSLLLMPAPGGVMLTYAAAFR